MSEALILAGPTATGKTAVANEIARRTGALVLSADSMLVYRGMDIGTAKPAPAELRGIDFRGADLAAPDEEFNAWRWLEAARAAFADAEKTARPVIVAGGTGLYINALARGLDAPAPPAPGLRAELENLLAEGGAPALFARAEALSPGAAAGLSDPRNPRRLIRLIERLETGAAPPSPPRATCDFSCAATPAAGLDAPPEILAARIQQRAEKMFRDGLLDEAAALRSRYPEFSRTAGKGIGYAEALAVLDGGISVEEAIEKTALRTRQLAKRQRAWFRRQLAVEWTASPADETDVARAAAEIEKIWRRNGSAKTAL